VARRDFELRRDAAERGEEYFTPSTQSDLTAKSLSPLDLSLAFTSSENSPANAAGGVIDLNSPIPSPSQLVTVQTEIPSSAPADGRDVIDLNTPTQSPSANATSTPAPSPSRLVIMQTGLICRMDAAGQLTPTEESDFSFNDSPILSYQPTKKQLREIKDAEKKEAAQICAFTALQEKAAAAQRRAYLVAEKKKSKRSDTSAHARGPTIQILSQTGYGSPSPRSITTAADISTIASSAVRCGTTAST
jgi:hypothetical protein